MLKLKKLGLFVIVVALLGLPKLAWGDAVQAAQSDQFVDSIGLATHLNYFPEDTYWSTLEPMLTGLGIRHIRDGVFSTSGDQATYDPELVDLAYNHGIKSTLCMTYYTSQGILDPTQIGAQLTYMENTTYSQYGGVSLVSTVDAIEGPNEWDVNHPSGDGNWIGELTTFQQDLYNDVAAIPAFDNVLVVGPSMAIVQDQASLPNMSSMVDTGNDHPYPGTGDIGYSGLDDYLTDSQTTWPSAPLQVTEDGYETNPNSGDSDAVTQAYQGNMEPHICLENFRRGVQRTFLYDFVDEGTSSDTNGSHHFGLVVNDSTSFPVKPAYNSIKNLISILSDQGAAFTPAATSFNLSGTTADVHTLLLQKRSGNFYLVLWVETTNQSASQSVAVTFDQQMATAAYTYNPCVSATATNVSLTNNAINLVLTTQPTILEVTPNSGGGSLLVDDLANLNDTNTNLDWITTGVTPSQWLGRTTEAYRTAANGSNYLTYYNPNGIQGFTALLGYGWNTANPDGVTYDFTKIQLFSSPNGSTWTSVPSYVGEIDKSATFDASGSARWFTPVSPSGALPAGTNYVKFVVNSTDNVALPQLFQMNIWSGSDTVNDDSSAIAYSGTWTYQTNAGGMISDDQHYTNDAGASAQLTFTGTNATWLETTYPNQGYTDVYIDGTLYATVDGYSSSAVNQQQVFWKSGLSSGQHIIKLVCNGTKDSNSSGTLTALDAFVTGTPTTVNDNSSAVTYSGSWTYATGATGMINSDQHYTDATGAYAQFSFTGSAVSWIETTYTNQGYAAVYIDGVLQKTVDGYASTPANQQQMCMIAGLSSGQHTIKVVCNGTKDSGSTGTYISVDAFQYYQ